MATASESWAAEKGSDPFPSASQEKPGKGSDPISAAYVGSATCRTCHTAIYERWSKTRMANVVTDPRVHPEVIIPDLSKPDPLVTFTKDDIALVYGSKWKQRYFTRSGNDYYPQAAQWDVINKVWRAYAPAPTADWWVKFYPPDNKQRPTGPLCDGCHSVNYNVQTKTVTEWNVGCEKCHGPGSEHARRPGRGSVVNPARLETTKGTDLCVQCHSQGRPLTNPIAGQYYDWAVGFQAGLDLKNFWELDEHKLGETTFTHFGDGSAHKNRMQGNDYVQSLMSTRGVRCYACHDVHGTPYAGSIRQPGDAVCLQCHGPQLQPGPRGTIEQHTQHALKSEGSRCVACHMPLIARTIADVNVRSHTFRFISPVTTERLGVPSPCISCHQDRSSHWAIDALKKWPSVSPWRVAE